MAGSSPRMRGAPIPRLSDTTDGRIIPAYAGSTKAKVDGNAVDGDHPRVCGEHYTAPCACLLTPGSSPRMRGAPRTLPIGHGIGGIIPAYAGSTRIVKARCGGLRDHPRVCGEHARTSLSNVYESGSSPRMRGAHGTDSLRRSDAGIIPAYAGSTRSNPFIARPQSDHPRVCGEHSVSQPCKWRCTGSSPRMRGARGSGRHKRRRCGIIPAYAGSTLSYQCPCFSMQDHPRVCGEHDAPRDFLVHLEGSSPRMRGARRRGSSPATGHRIIPAYAGSTCNNQHRTYRSWDHPRVCGEHTVSALGSAT